MAPLLRGVTLAYARLRDPDLADWISENSRISGDDGGPYYPLPQTPADIAEVTRLTGHADAAPVVHEPFFQWVIENKFNSPRPDFAAAEVQMVADFAPFEAAKLRCLNGTHSAIAYLGALAALPTVRQACENPTIAAFIRALWAEEILPSLETPPGMELPAYTDSLMARYLNPGIEHRTPPDRYGWLAETSTTPPWDGPRQPRRRVSQSTDWRQVSPPGCCT